MPRQVQAPQNPTALRPDRLPADLYAKICNGAWFELISGEDYHPDLAVDVVRRRLIEGGRWRGMRVRTHIREGVLLVRMTPDPTAPQTPTGRRLQQELASPPLPC